jgi:proline iminopeptidase
VPTLIVHGRRDLTCLLEASWTVHRRLPHSKLVILRDAGHLANEPAMIDALVSATDHLPESLS